MRPILLIVFCVFAQIFRSDAQVNFLTFCGEAYANPVSYAVEYGNSYYILATYDVGMASGSPAASFTPMQLWVKRYHKLTGQLLHEAVVSGDLVANDSGSILGHLIVDRSGVQILMTKVVAPPGSDSSAAHYALSFMVLDTTLHALIPERQIATFPFSNLNTTGIPAPAGMPSPQLGEKRIRLFEMIRPAYHTGITSKYILFDNAWNILANDTVGIWGFSHFNGGAIDSNYNEHWVQAVTALSSDSAYLFAGQNIGKARHETFWPSEAVLHDADMNLIDSFIVSNADVCDACSFSTPIFVYRPPRALLLKSGSLYLANPSNIDINGYRAMVVKFKMVPGGFEFVAKRSFQWLPDSVDKHSTPTAITTSLSYNEVDKRVYHVGGTVLNGSGPLDYDLNYNYLKVACMDTNLNLIWVKYLKSDTGTFFIPGAAINADQRPGVNVAGFISGSGVPFEERNFLFYFDSTAPPSGITHLPGGATLRGRFVCYPNPATATLYIDDVEGAAGTATLTDIQGRTLRSLRLQPHAKNVMNIQGLPPGMYQLLIRTEDGWVESQKIHIR